MSWHVWVLLGVIAYGAFCACIWTLCVAAKEPQTHEADQASGHNEQCGALIFVQNNSCGELIRFPRSSKFIRRKSHKHGRQ